MENNVSIRWGWLKGMYIYTILGAGGFAEDAPSAKADGASGRPSPGPAASPWAEDRGFSGGAGPSGLALLVSGAFVFPSPILL